jgi:hypothetical protein
VKVILSALKYLKGSILSAATYKLTSAESRENDGIPELLIISLNESLAGPPYEPVSVFP